MKRSIALVLLVVCLAAVLVACGGSSDIVGKWQDESGMTTMEFRNDGKLGAFLGDTEIMTVDYKTEGDKLTITVMGQESTSTYKIEGNVLTITDQDGTATKYNRK